MEKYILVEYLNNLNSVISQTLKSSKRIKLISFDVSSNYIIFGASSGGVYIFKREPCEFIKLIPSKEGAATKTLISSTEKNIAIGTSKGSVVILENFMDLNLKYFVHNLHENNTINEIIWKGNDVYCGDNIGKISIFSLTNLVTIFNPPSAVLMQLDSSIVQIDACLNYLLISTQTRTYLCDIEKEQYKQVGKKIRDGHFGACFFNKRNKTDLIETYQHFQGSFRSVTEEEHFTTSLSNPNIKIFCARPGARIWEVNFEASVLVTYQFRETLAQLPSDILHVADTVDAKLSISTFEASNEPFTNFNFGKIYPICNHFLFTCSAEGIYIFDPKASSLLLWSNNFKNIRDFKILNNVLYIWQNSSQMHTMSIELLETLIIKTLLNKQYYLSAEISIKFIEEVINMVDTSDKIHLISILKFKLTEMGATSLLEKMSPILCKLEEYKKENIVGKKITNGIAVENTFKDSIFEECYEYTPESVQKFNKSNGNLETINVYNLQSHEDLHEQKIKQALGVQPNIEESVPLSLYWQYQLNKTHKNAELTEPTTLLEQLNLDQMLLLFKDFIKYVERLDKTDATLWCKEQFLKQASRKISQIGEVKRDTLKFLNETFVELNKKEELVCTCQYPLPKTHKYPLEYYDLGCEIFNRLENLDSTLNLIPYLYKNKLSRINNLNDLLLHLPLLAQFSDRRLFEKFIDMFTYDTWDEIVKLLIKLKQGICLNCGESIDLEGVLPWKILGLLMIKSIGPKNTSRLMKRYSTHIPDGELDSEFYQCCILASTFSQPNLAVNFMENVLSEKTSQKFEDLIEKFLHRKYLGNPSVTIKCDGNTEVPKCVYCELPLNEPIINEVKTCVCGHRFHSLCLISINNICNICTS